MIVRNSKGRGSGFGQLFSELQFFFLGLFDGVKGAFVGFLYGVTGGLFLIHESLRGNKK